LSAGWNVFFQLGVIKPKIPSKNIVEENQDWTQIIFWRWRLAGIENLPKFRMVFGCIDFHLPKQPQSTSIPLLAFGAFRLVGGTFGRFYERRWRSVRQPFNGFRETHVQSQINGFGHDGLNVAETGGKSSGRFSLYPLAVCGFSFAIKGKASNG
jgi:hypothetical protein